MPLIINALYPNNLFYIKMSYRSNQIRLTNFDKHLSSFNKMDNMEQIQFNQNTIAKAKALKSFMHYNILTLYLQ